MMLGRNSAGLLLLSLLLPGSWSAAWSAPLPVVPNVEWQPLAAQARRVIEALGYLGDPLTVDEKRAIEAALAGNNSEQLQKALDAHCLFGVSINPEMRVKVAQGPAKPQLVEQGWRVFLVKVQNESGSTASLRSVSPNGRSLYDSGSAN